MEEIKTVLHDFKKGNSSKEYDALIFQLGNPAVENSFLIQVLRSLRDCVSLLDQDFEYLIGTILKLDWVHKEQHVVIEYQAFILNLVSAHTFYLKSCMKSLINFFKPVLVKEVTDELRVKERQAFVNVHTLLQSIIKIVPMTPTLILPLVAQSYPYITRPGFEHECYVRNLFHIPQYIPAFRQQIMSLVIEKILELDTRSSRQDIQDALSDDEDDHEDMTVDEAVFKMDISGSKECLSKKIPMNKKLELKHHEADKLDIIMEFLLQTIHNICHPNGELDWEATKKFYRELLCVFDSVVLPTHLSSHVQFLMFYVCSFKQPLADGFIDYLWKKVKDPNTQQIYRQSAVAYLSSFVARASYVSISTAISLLEHMAEWIHLYLQEAHFTYSGDIAHHGPFFSVCQGLFYIFIFRHKEILNLKTGYSICQKLNFQCIVTSRLNPLKVCLPVVVKTFSSISRQHQLAFCDAINEHNKRSLLPITTLDGGNNQLAMSRRNALDSFFPFDPYILPRSKILVEPLYRKYSGNPIEEDVIDNEDDDDFLPVNETGAQEPFRKNSLDKHTNSDFLLCGTSPGFKIL